MRAPGYWLNETFPGRPLHKAVEAYLTGAEMTADQVQLMRAYLRQWIAADWVPGPALDALRAGIDGLVSRETISIWLADALDENIDPL